MLNYYPQDKQFQVLDLEEVESQLDRVLELVDGDIYLTEIGYQSGEEFCNSSEEKQAQFYHWVFQFWDENIDKVQFMQINWMHDISAETLNFYAGYYGSNAAPFLEYLGTLGLKNHDESPKLAWRQILEDTRARGWR